MQTFSSTSYSIEIGSITDSSLNQLLIETYATSKVVIICDENTHDYCLEYLLTSFDSLKEAEVMLLPVGEENKVMEVCFQVWQALSEYKIGRKDLIINLGGGVVTDMGGFIAAVYKRGVDFVHIPSSLLGMVDASIGGKTGIDLGSLKNQLGVFAHPVKIYIDPIFLGSLPSEEMMNGYAEMLKHALIRNKEHWNVIKAIENIDLLNSVELISESVKIKFEVVEIDPKEKNIRKLLNFGHTVGHALEGYFLNSTPISHGHAVAVGMLAESYISFKKGILSKTDFNEIDLLLRSRFPIPELNEDDFTEIVELCQHDKKNEANKINCTLLKEIGQGEIDQFVTVDELKDALTFLTLN
jgi:3-dehydroquinate synthase